MRKNIVKFYLASLTESMEFYWPIYVIYFNQILKIPLSQVFLAESLRIYLGFLANFFGGPLADILGRKKILIFGRLLSFLGIFILIKATGFVHLLLWAFVSGIGTFVTGGTDSALIFDTLKALGEVDSFKKITARWRTLFYLGRSFASFFGGFLYKVSPSFPFLLSLIPSVVGLIAFLSMKEAPFEKKKRNIFSQVKLGFLIIKKSASLRFFVIYFLLFTALANILFKLYQPYMEIVELPITYFGVVYTILNLISAGGAFFFEKLIDIFSSIKLQHLMMFGAGLSGLIMALVISKTSIFWIFVISFIFGLRDPLRNYFVNHKIKESDKRATVLSQVSLASNLAFATGVFLLGQMTAVWKVEQVFLFAGFLMILTFLLFLHFEKKIFAYKG